VNTTDVVNRFIHKYSRLPTERDPDYLEMLRMSRYRILARPDVGPALKCSNCGSAREGDRQYVDFGLYVDWYGQVFICTLCLADIALHAGLFKAAELKILQLEQQIEDLKTSRVSAEDLKSTFLRTYEEVKNHFDSLYPVGSESVSNSVPDVGSDAQPTDKDASVSNSSVKTPERKVTKPATSSGSKDLPLLTALLSPDN
jgi:hypothetical protein